VYKVLFVIFSLLLTSCVNSPITRGEESPSYGTRDVKLVFDTTKGFSKVALVIGNNNYQKNPRLTNAVPDAKAVRDFFTNRGFRAYLAEIRF